MFLLSIFFLFSFGLQYLHVFIDLLICFYHFVKTLMPIFSLILTFFIFIF